MTMPYAVIVITLVAGLIAIGPRAIGQSTGAQWLQWGGPQRNFVTDSKGLATTWPASGPRRLWSRALGEGHSSILVDGNRGYTMYRPLGVLSLVRRSQQEVVLAFDAATGKTVWEHTFDAPTAGLDFQYGAGPHVTALIVGNRLFTAGSNKQLFALDKQTGQVLWSHHLINEYGGPAAGRGYSCSPLAYKNTVIFTGGPRGAAVMAFNQADGTVVWKSQSFEFAPASPILIAVDGQDQVVVFGGDGVYGLDPTNGALLWSHPHRAEWGLNISTPLWGPDKVLFISSARAYNGGSRALQLTRASGKTQVAEWWHTNRFGLHFGSAIRLGDFLYGSNGDFGPAFISAVNLRNGNVAWQDRSFARAQLLHADGKLVVLDEDGTVGIVTVSPDGLKVLARAEVMTEESWTPPTLVGTRLYLRDRKNMVALDLGG